jgi:hypothetical protein
MQFRRGDSRRQLERKLNRLQTGTGAATLDLQAQLDGKEPALGNPAADGHVLRSTAAGVRSWTPAPTGGAGGTLIFDGGTPSSTYDGEPSLDCGGP